MRRADRGEFWETAVGKREILSLLDFTVGDALHVVQSSLRKLRSGLKWWFDYFEEFLSLDLVRKIEDLLDDESPEVEAKVEELARALEYLFEDWRDDLQDAVRDLDFAEDLFPFLKSYDLESILDNVEVAEQVGTEMIGQVVKSVAEKIHKVLS